MSKREESGAEPSLEDFAGEVTHEPADWRWLWQRELEGSFEDELGFAAKIAAWGGKLFRKLTGGRSEERRGRQNRFNLVLLSHLENLDKGLRQDLHRVQQEIVVDLQSVRTDLIADLQQLNSDLEEIDRAFAAFKKDGLGDLSRQTEALFSVLDQKLDRVRRQVKDLAPPDENARD